LRAAAAFALPRFRTPVATASPAPGARTFAELLRPWFILPLVGVAIVMASHMILNAFQGLLWARQGIGLGMIGLLIGFGAVAETAMFFFWGRVRTKAPLRVLLIVAGMVTVLRWVLMATAPGVLWLWPLQALHGITFGMTLMASLAFVNEHTTDQIAAAAQSLNMMLQQAMSVVAIAGFGLLADAVGAASYLASAAGALLGITAIALSLRLRPPA
jgi:PPP family 3-phenylpropionic acid transporter